MSATTETPATKIRPATLVRSERITPAASPEDVRHLVFRRADDAFDCQAGQCVRVMAPGQYGNQYHPRLYLVAEQATQRDGSSEFAICVKRHNYIDDFNGERYPGIASNYLCDLPLGAQVQFAGPVGYPFRMPDNPAANILMIGMGTGIAPFRALVRSIDEKYGYWHGKIRLFYGARSGLEMLYMNDENRDLGQYINLPTFKAFQALSPRPAFDAPVEFDQAIAQNAAEIWEMLQSADTYIYLAGVAAMQASVNRVLGEITGSTATWFELRDTLKAAGRWHEVLY